MGIGGRKGWMRFDVLGFRKGGRREKGKKEKRRGGGSGRGRVGGGWEGRGR